MTDSISGNSTNKIRLPYSESELLDDMTPDKAHVDLVPDKIDSNWDSWFDGPVVTGDFMVEREQSDDADRK